jgi:hypothetical protein
LVSDFKAKGIREWDAERYLSITGKKQQDGREDFILRHFMNYTPH